MLKLGIIFAALAVCYGTPVTKYTLFNQANPLGRDITDTAILDDAGGDTIIVIHGHLGRPSDSFNLLIRNEILTHRRQEQILEVDWKDVASTDYATASRSVELIAAELATFMSELRVRYNNWNIPKADVKHFHLVGFGLGAHIAGMASRQLEVKVGRITGLDPAGSGWDTTSGRLNQSDADYVEVIHTDGLDLLGIGLGIGTEIGQVNFYVNGGSNQPGCFSHSCGHNLAYEVFAASLSNSNLIGYACSSMTQMNLNQCTGQALLVGDTKIDKTTGINPSFVYRINTARIWPY